MLEHITRISFWDIDNVMIEGYGFEKWKEDEYPQKHFAKLEKSNYSDALLISIINVEEKPHHMLDIRVGKSYSIREIKDNLVDSGYLYEGTNKLKVRVYRKDEIMFLIADEPNEMGATQILVMYDE